MIEPIKLSGRFFAYEETKGMAKGEYIPLLITFFQEIAYGRKLCLPLRLEPIGFLQGTYYDPNTQQNGQE
jgi:hypothetical protein